jgi:glycosyltransferase involved in cell wall biosynthesis
MRILMFTNAYKPLVGGVTRSIEAFTDQFRARGHRVVIVAPRDPLADDEEDVIRYPALTRVVRERYAVALPIPRGGGAVIDQVEPNIIHAHHPYLLGRTAQAGAKWASIPLIYTHHTRLDLYLAALTSLPQAMIDFVHRMTIDYCNQCEAVVTPSRGIADLLHSQGLTSQTAIIPTGVDVERFRPGDKQAARERFNLPADALVVGHVGRLDEEKNLGFLSEAVGRYLQESPRAHLVLIGDGAMTQTVLDSFERSGLGARVHHLGMLAGEELVDAYRAMDVFAFASQSETQGMVLSEAMACCVPVVAVSAIGVDDLVIDGVNGRLLAREDAGEFAAALRKLVALPTDSRRRMFAAARRSAEEVSLASCADRMLQLYDETLQAGTDPSRRNHPRWMNLWNYRWRAWRDTFKSASEALIGAAPVTGTAIASGSEESSRG